MRLHEAGVGRHTCSCHRQDMGSLPCFSHAGLTKWIDRELDKKGKDCGMGWIHRTSMEDPPGNDLQGKNPSYLFQRMLLWVAAMGCREPCPTLTEFMDPWQGHWGDKKNHCIKLPNQIRGFGAGSKSNYQDEYNDARSYVRVRRGRELCVIMCGGVGCHATPTALCNRT